MGFSLEFVVYHVLLGTLPMDSYEKCRFRECSQYRSASRSISIDALYEAREDVLAWLCRVEGQLHVAAFHSTRDGTPGPLMSEAFDVRVSRNVNGDVEWTFPIDGSESLAACKVSRTHRVLWTPHSNMVCSPRRWFVAWANSFWIWRVFASLRFGGVRRSPLHLAVLMCFLFCHWLHHCYQKTNCNVVPRNFWFTTSKPPGPCVRFFFRNQSDELNRSRGRAVDGRNPAPDMYETLQNTGVWIHPNKKS